MRTFIGMQGVLSWLPSIYVRRAGEGLRWRSMTVNICSVVATLLVSFIAGSYELGYFHFHHFSCFDFFALLISYV